MPRRPSPSKLLKRDEESLKRAEGLRHLYSRGHTLQELAELSGLHKASVSRIVRGQSCARAAGPVAETRIPVSAALSDTAIRKAREAATAGTDTASIAELHGLSPSTTRKLLRGDIRPEAGGPFVNFEDRGAGTKVAKIRAQYAAGASQRSLAVEHHLSRSAIGAIVRGELHADAPGPTRRHPAPHTKHLTPAKVRDIREAYASGTTLTELASRHDKLLSSIAHVVMGRTYRHVGGPTGAAARAAHRLAREALDGKSRGSARPPGSACSPRRPA